ncbi:MAG TPA: hypothetical protein VD929_03290 [Caulobacteraceae bacterium]|nr:hypothetical protein [Caulobacteraceae bacterium]
MHPAREALAGNALYPPQAARPRRFKRRLAALLAVTAITAVYAAHDLLRNHVHVAENARDPGEAPLPPHPLRAVLDHG